MSPEDAWRDNRAAVEIQCNAARADERRRIVDYLRGLGGWGAVAAAALEGDDYWRHERAELVRDRRVSHGAQSAPSVHDEQQTSSDGAP